MQQSLNFTFEIKRPPFGAWGFTFKNGTVGGMVGMVNRSEVDFAIGPFAVYYGRHLFIDYSHTVHLDRLQFLLSLKPQNDPWAIFRPFGWRVWMSIILVTPLYLISMGITDLAFFGETRWIANVGFVARQLLKQPRNSFPRQKLYKMIFICAWAWPTLVLLYGYEGKSSSII